MLLYSTKEFAKELHSCYKYWPLSSILCTLCLTAMGESWLAGYSKGMGAFSMSHWVCFLVLLPLQEALFISQYCHSPLKWEITNYLQHDSKSILSAEAQLLLCYAMLWCAVLCYGIPQSTVQRCAALCCSVLFCSEWLRVYPKENWEGWGTVWIKATLALPFLNIMGPRTINKEVEMSYTRIVRVMCSVIPRCVWLQ